MDEGQKKTDNYAPNLGKGRKCNRKDEFWEWLDSGEGRGTERGVRGESEGKGVREGGNEGTNRL